jgi:adenylyl cyclase-associated protein
MKEVLPSSEFYVNRVLVSAKGTKQEEYEWALNFNKFCKSYIDYVKAYHTTGLSWNPQGGDAATATPSAPSTAPPSTAPAPVKSGGAAALFGEISKGTDISKGLKKVTPDMKTKHRDPNDTEGLKPKEKTTTTTVKAAPAKKDPIFKQEGSKWTIAHQVSVPDMKITEGDKIDSFLILSCEKSSITITNKVNSIIIEGCKRVSVKVESIISSVEIVNSQNIDLICSGRIPTISVDKSDSVNLHFGKDTIKEGPPDVVTSKSSAVNINIPGATADSDPIELPVPEQFRTVIKDGKLTTSPVTHA